jgi:LacI family transcriptional regulator
VAIVSAELSNPFYPALIEPLHDSLADAGYRTILVTDRGEAPVEIQPLIDGSLDGVVITTSLRNSALPAELKRRGVPFVLVNRAVDDLSADSCLMNNRAGAAAVADALVDLGHRNLGAILGPSSTTTGLERAEGFHDRLVSRGVSLSQRYLRQGPFEAGTGYDGLQGLLEQIPQPTGIFCGNDVIALGVCNAARAWGVRIPEDLTVIGFDDIPMASWEVFNLTTMQTDLKVLADGAVNLLLNRLQNPDSEVLQVRVQSRLVLRGTHAKAPT